MPDPEWLDYQQLAASIYSELEPNAVVRHDDKIRGVTSGIERQIDVSIRTAVAGHELLIIVQAKALARPADVNVVGEFHAVIQDVQAAKGVLICSAGFTSTALDYGRKLNIDLCTAHDAAHRKWSLDLKIPLLWMEVSGEVSLEMDLKGVTHSGAISLPSDAGTWPTSVDGGRTLVSIGELLATVWHEQKANQKAGMLHRVELGRPGMKIRLGDSFWCPVESLKCAYTISRSGWLGTFPLSHCRGIMNRGTGTVRARVRITNTDVPLQREPDWTPVVDPDSVWEAGTAGIMVRIERNVGPESFTFATFEIGPVDELAPEAT